MSAEPTRILTMQLEVTVPAEISDSTVEEAINNALDESPLTGLDWGDWTVGAVTVTSTTPCAPLDNP